MFSGVILVIAKFVRKLSNKFFIGGRVGAEGFGLPGEKECLIGPIPIFGIILLCEFYK